MPELVITHRNRHLVLGDGETVLVAGHPKQVRGILPRRTTYGQNPLARPLTDTIPLIPRSEWPDRIARKDADKSWLIDLVRPTMPVLDQDGLGYCHAYACVQAAMAQRLVQHHEFIPLSPESIGGPITHWQNEGANPEDDMLQLARVGACAARFMDKPWSLCPDCWDPAWQADCALHKCTEWYDCGIPGKTFDALVTCALLNLPVHAGFYWWGHAVYGALQVRRRDQYEVLWRNSWGPDFGDDGYFWMPEGDEGTPDDCTFAPRAMTPSLQAPPAAHSSARIPLLTG